jgi:hypothetical protein
MWFFYVMALLPISIGLIIWIKNKEVCWKEWLGGCAVALVLAVLFQVIATIGATHDTETWSGVLVKAVHYPRWVEEYWVTETYTTGSGKNKQTHTRRVRKERVHPEHWTAYANFGKSGGEYGISRNKYHEILRNFTPKGHAPMPKVTQPYKSGFCRGDRNIYTAINKTGYVYPMTCRKSWENRIKASTTVFSFTEPPEGLPLHKYPISDNPWVSDRLLGAKAINIYDWDCMNSRLGPTKKVNVILIHFRGHGSQMAHYQEAKWLGGRKNDLVLCYGDDWAYVFGWTEKSIVKRNLETILLDNKIDNSIIPLIEQEIIANYELKDWSKFDYIAVEPPMWSYIVYIIVLIVAQVGFYIWAHMNEIRERWGRKPREYPFR